MVLFIVVASAIILLLDDKNPVPSVEMEDGVDYVPAKKGMLLGQHFSAIAAAGPINGPILAAVIYGWAPALLWVILGCIFIGGIHDMGSLVASVRHKAKSITEVVRLNCYCGIYRYYGIVFCRQRNAGKRRSCFRRRYCKFLCNVSCFADYYGPVNALWRLKRRFGSSDFPASGWRCNLGRPVSAA